MLTIGEFSNICKVSAKTLRYYAEIGLIQPEEINQETGYRYYSVNQLKRMLFINRLKAYGFTLMEIKAVIDSEEPDNDPLFTAMIRKQGELISQLGKVQTLLNQMEADITALKQGKPLLAYLEEINVQLADVPEMCILSIRKSVYEEDMAAEYKYCFSRLFRKIACEKLSVQAPPMVLFHSAEFSAEGMDIEFAVPIRECVKGSRDFKPGLCLKTVLHGSYTQLPSVYAKQREWAEQEGFVNSNALYEIYMTDPLECKDESELVTEIYYPVKKISESK